MNITVTVGCWLLRALLPAQHRDVVFAHIEDELTRVRASRSLRQAARWHARQVWGSIPGALRMRIQSRHHNRPLSTSGRFGGWLTDLLHDALYGLRQMRRAPGFSIAAVLMLAIGLGLVAGAYTVVNGLFIREWDVPDNASVFKASGTIPGLPEGARVDDGLSYGAFKHIRAGGWSAGGAACLTLLVFWSHRLTMMSSLLRSCRIVVP